MSRFFSKLDLRDIKITPQGSRFPPDEEAYAPQETATSEFAQLPEPLHSVEETWIDPGTGAPIPATHAPIDADEFEVRATGEVLKVSARSRPSAVAGAIAGVVRESGRAEVQAIGAGATNQAV